MRHPPHQRKGNRDGGVYFNVQPYQPGRQTSHPHHYAQGKKIESSILLNSETHKFLYHFYVGLIICIQMNSF